MTSAISPGLRTLPSSTAEPPLIETRLLLIDAGTAGITFTGDPIATDRGALRLRSSSASASLAARSLSASRHAQAHFKSSSYAYCYCSSKLSNFQSAPSRGLAWLTRHSLKLMRAPFLFLFAFRLIDTRCGRSMTAGTGTALELDAEDADEDSKPPSATLFHGVTTPGVIGEAFGLTSCFAFGRAGGEVLGFFYGISSSSA